MSVFPRNSLLFLKVQFTWLYTALALWDGLRENLDAVYSSSFLIVVCVGGILWEPKNVNLSHLVWKLESLAYFGSFKVVGNRSGYKTNILAQGVVTQCFGH